MKRKIIAICLATMICIAMFALAGCNQSINDIIDNKPNVTGIVEELRDNHIIIRLDTMQGYSEGTLCEIPLNVEYKDSYTNMVVGDEIVVYYDGEIMETYPLQIGTVYAITLKTPADREINNQS